MIRITLLFCILLISSCKKNQSDEYTLYINSKQTECYAPFQMLCPEVRTTEEDNFSITYKPIAEFGYQYGHQYELRVYDQYDFPTLEDGSSVTTHIVDIISREEDPVGTTYTYTIGMRSSPVSKLDDGTYKLFELTFLCDEYLDCESLLNEHDDSVTISFTFIYEGNELMNLSNWFYITNN